MKTIVVPFDFSSHSVAALKTAQKISAKSGAKIVCITVIPSEIDWDLLSDEAKKKHPELLAERQEAIDVLPEYISAIAPAKAPIETIFRIGVPNELILRVIDESKADLVVLGAYGKGYVEGKFIGSTLQKVLRKAPCPVLAVKHALDGNDFRKLAFASVFEEGAKFAFQLEVFEGNSSKAVLSEKVTVETEDVMFGFKNSAKKITGMIYLDELDASYLTIKGKTTHFDCN